MKKFTLVSLGCPKNLVDSERISDILVKKGYILKDSGECDIAVINTCAFISSAVRESDRVIKEFVDLKKRGKIKRLIVCGCLVSRYKKDVIKRYPDVDAFAEVESLDGLERWLDGRLKQNFISSSSYFYHQSRFLLTKNHIAYLKISDGCNNRCSYCVIPNIRGSFRSRRIEDITAEALALSKCGVKELVIVSQDTLNYGSDIYSSDFILRLLEKLERIESVEWIRLMYLYPSRINKSFLRHIKASKKILHYFDLPLQHVSSKILRLMNRRYDEELVKKTLDMIFSNIEDAVVRTNFIVGFPYETEEDFKKIVEVVEDYPLSYVNVFKYSREKGSILWGFEQIPSRIKNERYKLLLSKASKKIDELNRRIIGKEFVVIADSSKHARSYMDGPDIDGVFEVDRYLERGSFYKVRVINASGKVRKGFVIGRV